MTFLSFLGHSGKKVAWASGCLSPQGSPHDSTLSIGGNPPQLVQNVKIGTLGFQSPASSLWVSWRIPLRVGARSPKQVGSILKDMARPSWTHRKVHQQNMISIHSNHQTACSGSPGGYTYIYIYIYISLVALLILPGPTTYILK